MDIITQKAHHRKRFVLYAQKHSVTEASIRYKTSRKTIHKWLNRYDGTIESLKDRSHKPHNSPRKHTEQELSLIRKVMKKVKWEDVIYGFQMVVYKGYTKSYGSFKKQVKKLKENKPKAKKYRKPKPYQRAAYPGQKVQVDVKYVPAACVATGKKYYVYVAKDECSRWTYRQMYDDKSSYSSFKFLKELIENCPFAIKRIQTDNGTEFTNALLANKTDKKSWFEKALEIYGIEYQRTRVATPRHNGKVERQNRTDELRFYKGLKMICLEEGREKLSKYQKKSNNIIMTCLGMKTPNQVLDQYRYIM